MDTTTAAAAQPPGSDTDSPAAVRTDGITRRFGNRVAVDGISLRVRRGEIFGLLGPNGAGKTTTLKMLTAQIRPTWGTALVAGLELPRDADLLSSRVGVLFETESLYERLSAYQNLAFVAQLYGVSASRATEALEKVGLSSRAKDPVGRFSYGMKRRVALARALLHDPSVIFLDEPTRGLDPDACRELHGWVRTLAAQGKTVFLVTHSMEEADSLCDRVGFIVGGRLVRVGSPQELKEGLGKRQVRVELTSGAHLVLPLDSEEAGRQLGQLAASGRVRNLHSAEATLEECFLHFTGRGLAE